MKFTEELKEALLKFEESAMAYGWAADMGTGSDADEALQDMEDARRNLHSVIRGCLDDAFKFGEIAGANQMVYDGFNARLKTP